MIGIKLPKQICKRCRKEFLQLEEHHLFPKFMDNPHGYSFENYPNRVNLCFTCHKALHQIIIIPMLNEMARTLKANGSEFWLWKQIASVDKMGVARRIVEASYKFIFERGYENDSRAT
jgi:hypothetical protein